MAASIPSSREPSLYDYNTPLPPEFAKKGARLAKEVTRRQRLVLWSMAGVTLVGGVILEVFADQSKDPLVRIGAILVLLSIVHASKVVKWSKIRENAEVMCIDICTKIETDKIKDEVPPEYLEKEAKARALRRVERVLPKLFSAIEREIVLHHLLVAAVGNFLMGFGDLLD
ncbi:MAG TPA: hypothetical protein VEY95_06810 [Azospirillaceae bacterium]|nr:hypothetical protein [Azospirillaceae bacterium]